MNPVEFSCPGCEFKVWAPPSSSLKCAGCDKELQAADDSRIINVLENGRFGGYAVKFNVPILSWWPTVFRPEGDDPFNLDGRDPSEIKILWQHRWSEPIGVYDLLELRDEGLWVEGQITASSATAAQARDAISKQIIDGLSIGMDEVLKAIWEEDSDFVWTDGKPLNDMLRVLQRVNLIETSPVTFPACLDARIELFSKWSRGDSEIPARLSEVEGDDLDFMLRLAKAHCVPLDKLGVRLDVLKRVRKRGGALTQAADPPVGPAGGDAYIQQQALEARIRRKAKLVEALVPG